MKNIEGLSNSSQPASPSFDLGRSKISGLPQQDSADKLAKISVGVVALCSVAFGAVVVKDIVSDKISKSALIGHDWGSLLATEKRGIDPRETFSSSSRSIYKYENGAWSLQSTEQESASNIEVESK